VSNELKERFAAYDRLRAATLAGEEPPAPVLNELVRLHEALLDEAGGNSVAAIAGKSKAADKLEAISKATAAKLKVSRL
jgi:hypothetical protein